MNTTLLPKNSKPTASPSVQEAKPRLSDHEPVSLHWKYRGEMHVWRTMRSTGVMGLVIAIPTALGMALGIWIDTLWPGATSWFSILAPVGFGLGCISAVLWTLVEQHKDNQ